jgi:DNA-binding transcriptional MerR regulator
MEYNVEELAAATGERVDTIRFYQAKGLLPSPRRVKRSAVYSGEHLERLKTIRNYQSQGFTLTLIKRLLGSDRNSKADALLAAVVDQSGDRTFTRSEVARMSGVPEPLLAAVESAGLMRPAAADGEPRYGEADVQMARAGMEILQQGFPLDELLGLAMRHAHGVDEVADTAIELFDRFVRKAGEEGRNGEQVTAAFRRLLPAVTTLVALHFQRTLLNRALGRLRESGEHGGLEAARDVLESRRLEVTWR